MFYFLFRLPSLTSLYRLYSLLDLPGLKAWEGEIWPGETGRGHPGKNTLAMLGFWPISGVLMEGVVW
jgi:hypothetical protein